MKCLYFFVLCFCLDSSRIFAADDSTHYYLFVGNPGVGKSAIINGMAKKVIAKSGRSVGSGLTSVSTSYKVGDQYFIDTPGLADIEKRELAALEIEKALKKDGNYHIFFVIQLRDLRIIDEDLASIKSILNCISDKNIKYNIIINKLTEEDYSDLSIDAMALLQTKIMNSLKSAPCNFIWISKDENLKNPGTQWLNFSDEERTLILKSVYNRIAPRDVLPIKIDEYQKLKEDMQRMIENFDAMIAGKDKEIAKLKEEADRLRAENARKEAAAKRKVMTKTAATLLLGPVGLFF